MGPMFDQYLQGKQFQCYLIGAIILASFNISLMFWINPYPCLGKTDIQETVLSVIQI